MPLANPSGGVIPVNAGRGPGPVRWRCRPTIGRGRWCRRSLVVFAAPAEATSVGPNDHRAFGDGVTRWLVKVQEQLLRLAIDPWRTPVDRISRDRNSGEHLVAVPQWATATYWPSQPLVALKGVDLHGGVLSCEGAEILGNAGQDHPSAEPDGVGHDERIYG